jgi:hypothetical protein
MVGHRIFLCRDEVLPRHGFQPFFILLGGLLTLTISVLATYMTSPARFYPDWIGGAFMEMGFVASIALLAAILTIYNCQH